MMVAARACISRDRGPGTVSVVIRGTVLRSTLAHSMELPVNVVLIAAIPSCQLNRLGRMR